MLNCWDCLKRLSILSHAMQSEELVAGAWVWTEWKRGKHNKHKWNPQLHKFVIIRIKQNDDVNDNTDEHATPAILEIQSIPSLRQFRNS
jgi:hypothetical protein